MVVSADYLERGLAAQSLHSTIKPTAARDTAVMLASLAAVEQASAQAGSVLSGVADPSQVAAAGHSYGGQTAFDALRAPGVTTAIGWAPVGPKGTPSSKPVMLIGSEGDTVIVPSRVRSEYAAFTGPKVLVEISGEGHNAYTDICVGLRSGGGLISYAIDNHLVKASVARLGLNGCLPTDPPPDRFWPIVQYYTVLQLHQQFHGSPGDMVPAPAPGQFPGYTVTVRQAP